MYPGFVISKDHVHEIKFFPLKPLKNPLTRLDHFSFNLEDNNLLIDVSIYLFML